MEQNRPTALRRELLAWYQSSQRDLPWRHTKDPYAIWVSEIMAQQTRITALLPYYQRFMARFPTVAALAAATDTDVLKAWEGLGYYSRALNLKKAAALILRDYEGRLPCTREALTALPGIGAYTAGAILSIAFHIPTPAVDGNVLRFFARVEENRTDIAGNEAKSAAADFVSTLLTDDFCGELTQALMEMGALVCTPKSPKCPMCPVSRYCRSFSHGCQESLPIKSPKKPQRPQRKTILVFCDDAGRVLMRRRTETLLHGLWEFVMVDAALEPPQILAYAKTLGFTPILDPMGSFRHVFTHLIWEMEGWFCQIHGPHSGAPAGFCFVSPEEAAALPLPSALRKYGDAANDRVKSILAASQKTDNG